MLLVNVPKTMRISLIVLGIGLALLIAVLSYSQLKTLKPTSLQRDGIGSDDLPPQEKRSTSLGVTEEVMNDNNVIRKLKRLGIELPPYHKGRIYSVIVGDQGGVIQDETMQCLGELSELGILTFSGTKFSTAAIEKFPTLKGVDRVALPLLDDSQLVLLNRFPNVTSLQINGASINGHGFHFVHPLKHLQMLDLSYSQINDDSLGYLSKFESLEILHLHHTRVTDQGFAHLAGCTKLKILVMTNSPVFNDGLESVVNIASLESINLAATHITDEGLAKLATATQLRTLSIGRNRVTDKGLLQLQTLKNLKRLYVENTDVTQAGVQELQRLLPQCEIANFARK